MQRPRRPAALAPEGGFINPDFIPRDELSELLPESLTGDAKGCFLDRCSEEVQMLGWFARNVPDAALVRELRTLAERARELAEAIGAMSEDARREAQVFADEVAYADSPAVEISDLGKNIVRRWVQGFPDHGDNLLLATFDLAADLEAVARYTASHLKPSRQGKLSERRARALVAAIARVHREITGRLPPRHPASWFAGFVGELGERLGLRCGSRLVRSVLLALAQGKAAVEPRPAAPRDGATPKKAAPRSRAKKAAAARPSSSRGGATPKKPALKIRTVRLLGGR